jgi:hypothetical protein
MLMALAFRFLEAVCVLVAAIMVGSWFMSEVRKSQAGKAPWYAPYMSLPGILIMLVLAVPIILWAIQNA